MTPEFQPPILLYTPDDRSSAMPEVPRTETAAQFNLAKHISDHMYNGVFFDDLSPEQLAALGNCEVESVVKLLKKFYLRPGSKRGGEDQTLWATQSAHAGRITRQEAREAYEKNKKLQAYQKNHNL